LVVAAVDALVLKELGERAVEAVGAVIAQQLLERPTLAVAVAVFGLMNCRGMFPVLLALVVLVLYISGIMFFDLTFI
jgi:hypothetical protein